MGNTNDEPRCRPIRPRQMVPRHSRRMRDRRHVHLAPQQDRSQRMHNNGRPIHTTTSSRTSSSSSPNSALTNNQPSARSWMQMSSWAKNQMARNDRPTHSSLLRSTATCWGQTDQPPACKARIASPTADFSNRSFCLTSGAVALEHFKTDQQPITGGRMPTLIWEPCWAAKLQ